MCYQLSFMGLCYIEKFHTYTLQEFKAAQIVRLQEVIDAVGQVSGSFLLRTLILPWLIILNHECLGHRAPRWFPKWGEGCGQEVVPLRLTCCGIYSWWLCVRALWGYEGWEPTGRVQRGSCLEYYPFCTLSSLWVNQLFSFHWFQTRACMHKL